MSRQPIAASAVVALIHPAELHALTPESKASLQVILSAGTVATAALPLLLSVFPAKTTTGVALSALFKGGDS